MNNRPYFMQLVTPYSQFDLAEKRFNHDAMAIFLHQRNKTEWRNRPVYLLAGSEDLRALLACLPMQCDGDEAFIIVRTKVYSIVLSLLRVNGKLITYCFDSQAWGHRYEPMRVIIETLTDIYPDNHIYISSTVVQDKYIQIGCTEYALACLEYLLQPQNVWMSLLQQQPSRLISTNHRMIYELDDGVVPDVLHELSVPVSRDNNRLQLEGWLAEHYSVGSELNWQRVNEVTREMQGAGLKPWRLDCPTLYQVNVDLDNATVKLTFNNSDYVYANCLVFSESLYPGSWQSYECILHDDTRVIVINDNMNKTLTFKSTSIKELVAAFQDLSLTPMRYKPMQMRQQQGLLAAINDILLAVAVEQELVQVMRPYTGGMDARQVQQALQFIFAQDAATIYVPPFEELSGADASLNLVALRARGVRFVISTMPVNNEHQAAIMIDVSNEQPIATVYDSQRNDYVPSHLVERVRKIVGENTSVEQGKLYFRNHENQDNGSCSVHVIANLEAAMGRRVGGALNKQDIEKLAKSYIRAGRYQQDAEQLQENLRKTNIAFNRTLLEMLKDAGRKSEKLVGFLHRYVGDTHSLLVQATPISQILRDYDATEPGDVYGQLVLRYANLTFPDIQEEKLRAILEVAIQDISFVVSANDANQLSKTKKMCQALASELQLELKNRPAPLAYLNEAVEHLLANDSIKTKLSEFLKFLRCDYDMNDSIDIKELRDLLVLEICSLASRYDDVVVVEKRRIQLERRAKEERMKRILVTLGVPNGELTPSITYLLQQPEIALLNITSKDHLNLLSFVTDPQHKVETVLKFIDIYTTRKNPADFFVLLECLGAQYKKAAASAYITKTYGDQLSHASPGYESSDASYYSSDESGDDSVDAYESYEDRELKLFDYILSGSSQAEALQTVRDWVSSGVHVRLELLDRNDQCWTYETKREFIKIVANENWNSEYFSRFLDCVPKDERFDKTCELVWGSTNANLLVTVMVGVKHEFITPQLLHLVSGFRGTICESQSSKIFEYFYKINESLLEYLCESWSTLKTHEMSIRDFLLHASANLLESSVAAENTYVSEMIKRAPEASIITILAGNRRPINIPRFLETYSKSLKSGVDIIAYLKSLPLHMRAAAFTENGYVLNRCDDMMKILDLFYKEDVDPFIQRHMDLFLRSNDTSSLLRKVKGRAIALEVLKAKEAAITPGQIDGILGEIAPSQLESAIVILLDRFDNIIQLAKQLERLKNNITVTRILILNVVAISDILRRTEYSYVRSVNNLLSQPIAATFIKTYIKCFNSSNLIEAYRIDEKAVLSSVKRGIPLFRSGAELLEFLKIINHNDRYIILQRNIEVVKDWSTLLRCLQLLEDNMKAVFLQDYHSFIIELYPKHPGNRLKGLVTELASVSDLSERRNILNLYAPHSHVMEDVKACIRDSSLTNDDRINVLMSCRLLFTSLEQVLEFKPHLTRSSEMLEYLRTFLFGDTKITTDNLVSLLGLLLDDCRLPFMRDMIQKTNCVSAETIINAMDMILPADHLDFITMSLDILGTNPERWNVIRHVIDKKTLLLLSKTMIKSGDDLIAFTEVRPNRLVTDMLEVVKMHEKLISQHHLASLMRVSPAVESYLRIEKMHLIETPKIFSEVLAEIKKEFRFVAAAGLIKDYAWLVAAMTQLTPGEANSLLKCNEDKVGVNCNIAACLSKIIPEIRFTTALRFSCYIRSEWQFVRVLAELPAADRYLFVNNSGFNSTAPLDWLKQLSSIERYDYICNHSMEGCDFSLVVNCLDPSHRLTYVCDNLKLITSIEQYNSVKTQFTGESLALLEYRFKRHCLTAKIDPTKHSSWRIGTLFSPSVSNPVSSSNVTASTNSETNTATLEGKTYSGQTRTVNNLN